ncbi:MAG: hypothetical protein AMXMBFR64_44740 [Myxococcales bacterium]
MGTDTKAVIKHVEGLASAFKDLAAAARQLAKLDPELERNVWVADAALVSAEKALSTVGAVVPLADARAWVGVLRQRVDALKDRARSQTAAALSRELAALGLGLEGTIPELRCGVLTLELVFERAEVRIHFGPRIAQLAKAPLDAKEAAAAVKAALDALSPAPLDEPAYIAEVHGAWRRACLLGGQDTATGATVPIVAVLDQMAWGRQSARFRANPTRESFEGYGRVQLAWDLYRLSLRTHGDLELKLTVATREQTRSEAENLWVPRTARGEGTHFAGVAFRRTA